MKSIILCLLVSLGASAQKNCNFYVDGTGKAKGIKFNVPILCEYDRQDINDAGTSNTIKVFSAPIDNNTAIVQTLTVVQPQKPLLDDEISKKYLSDEGFKKFGGAGFISGKELTVDGYRTGQIIAKSYEQTPHGYLHFYKFMNFIFVKGKIVSNSFAISAKTDNRAKQVFEMHLKLFESLLKGTKFADSWD